jgi:proline dehydrogenase
VEFYEKPFTGNLWVEVSIDDCAATIEKLAARNVGTILDFAVEGEERDDLFDATCAEVIRTVEFAHNNRNVPFSAFRLPVSAGSICLQR